MDRTPGGASTYEPAPTAEELERMLAVEDERTFEQADTSTGFGALAGLLTGVVAGTVLWVVAILAFLSFR
jgi:hypothetical protein